MDKNTFSLHEIISPKFDYTDIKIDKAKCISNFGLPKPTRYLEVDNFGKVKYVNQ